MNTKPTQGLSASGRFEDRKNTSTYSLGAKSINTHGAPTANMVAGKYIQVVRSVITAFDSLIRLMRGVLEDQVGFRLSSTHPFFRLTLVIMLIEL
jgi:hypothetical protein